MDHSKADRTHRILIVDDDVSVRETLAAVLRSEGYEVEVASDLWEGVAHLQSDRIDLMIADQRLPGGGMNLLLEAQKLARLPATMILTGYGSLESAIEAIRKGAYDYLLKPCHPEELKLAVRRALERRRLEETEKLLVEIQNREKQLEALSKQLLHAQEEERQRIARDLHDESAQSMTTLKMMLEMIRKQLPPGSEAIEEQVEDAEALAMRTLHEIRRLIADLRPSMLDDFGLVPTLKWLAKESARRHGIEVVLERLAIADRLPPEIETTIFRTVQEALSNAVKHSGARRVSIRLERDRDRVMLEIRDDGVGFDPKRVPGPGVDRFGLQGIRERVTVLGGENAVVSRPGQGVTLRVSLPVARREAS